MFYDLKKIKFTKIKDNFIEETSKSMSNINSFIKVLNLIHKYYNNTLV